MTIWTISGIFESTSDFWILLPVHTFRFVAPGLLIGSISCSLCAIRRQYEAEYGSKERSEGTRGQTGSRNMVTTQFLDSTTPTSYLTKCRPKYTTTSGFANTLQVWPRRLFTRVFRITANFTTFRTISGTFESTSGLWIVLLGHRFRFGAPGFLIESISSHLHAIRGQNRPE